MRENRKRIGMNVIQTAIVSSIVIIFFASTVFLYYRLLFDAKKDNLIYAGKFSGEKVAAEVKEELSENEQFVEFASNLLNEMRDEVGSEQNIQKLIESQAAGLKLEGMKNINVYIDGKYYCDRDWGIPDDFDETAKTRPWYTQAIASGEVADYVDPYNDFETGETMIAIGKSLKGEGNVFSVDVTLDKIIELTKNAAKDDDVDAAMIITERGLVISHSDAEEIGKVYGQDDSLGTAIYNELLKQVDDFEGVSFEIEHDGVNYLIYGDAVYKDWAVVSIIDTTAEYQALQRMLVMTIAIIISIVLVIIFVMITANKRSIIAEQEIAVYKERMDIDRK